MADTSNKTDAEIAAEADAAAEAKAKADAEAATAAAAAADRTFTQDEVNRVVKERLARDREKYADYDEVKARAAKLDEMEAANATELEKAQKRAAELEQQAADATAKARESLLRATVIAEASRRNFNDPEDALALVRNNLEFDDTTGDPTNVAEAMDSLLAKKPYLVGGGARPDGADQGARGGGSEQLTREALKDMSPADIVKAQNEGRLDKVMGAT